MNRFGIAAGSILLAATISQPAFAQENSPVDLTGTWRWVSHEDWYERDKGIDPGVYWGYPLNDAARMRADTYDEAWISTSLALQCRPRPTGYAPLGLDPVRIAKLEDPLDRELVAYRVSWEKAPGDRMIWLDGRQRPSQYAHRSWEGFSTGTFKGDTLEITTTHLKESVNSRNGIPSGFNATVVEQIFLDEPYLTWVIVRFDPDYLTEPLVRSARYIRAPTLEVPAYPCESLDERQPGEPYRVPNYLPGDNPHLTEPAVKFRVPLEGMRGGAETTYPEWHAAGKTIPPPPAEYALKPVYNDASTRIAELAEAQPKSPPTYDKIETLHVAGDIYLIGGAGGNIAVSVGGDGVVMVDSGAAAASDKVLAAIRQIGQSVQMSKPRNVSDSASPFADTWQGTHAFAESTIRLIINTNADADHVGGNANIRTSMFRPPIVRNDGYSDRTKILAHAAVQREMLEAESPELAIPTGTYFSEKHTMYRFLNNQAIQIFHMPNSTTMDGASAVFFRRADVIVTGDVYNTDIYPPIDVDRGGSIDGEIEALNKLADMSVSEFMSQGGTLIIPGHGWISDAGELACYRDMMVIIRDRIQNMIDKGMTLQQVKDAKPTMDYDPLYGRQPGVTAQFVEAVYRSLKEQKIK